MARPYTTRDEGGEPSLSSSIPFKTIMFVILGFFGLMTLWSGGFNTHAGSVDIVLRMGNPQRVTTPGFNWKIPFFESRHTIELRERAYAVVLEAASKDPMEIPVTVTLNWAVNKEHVVQMYNQFGDLAQFEERIIKPRLPDAVKGVISTFSVNALLTDRAKVREASRKAIHDVIPQDIMTITGFAVTNIGFPPAYTNQIAAVQVAREAANAEQEVTRKQGFTAQQKVNTAKAEADAVKLNADAEAYRVLQTGKSILDNLDRQASILRANPLLVEYKKAEMWGGKFPDTFMGGEAAANILWNMAGQPKRQ